MNRKLALFFAIVLASGAFAQKPQPAVALEANLRKHVEYLASPHLEGRKTGEPGATTAAGYIVNQFSQFKLKPGFKATNVKPSFMQPFPFVSGVTVAESSFFRIVPANPQNENKLAAGVHYMPLANSIGGEIANAYLVFGGFGITTQDKKYDDYAGLEANGKAILVFDGAPDGASREQFGSFNLHAKASLAKEHGARALIVIAKADDFKADHLSRLNFEPTMGETAIPVIAVSREMSAQIFGVRTVADLAEIEKWIAMKTNAPPTIRISLANPPKATVTAKIDLQKKTVDAYNVIGIVEGRDSVLKNEAIVIGAHYDHLGRGGRSSLAANSTDIHHGADDNASGTAAIIELARQFAKDKKNKRTLIFMAFGGEEEGLLGSKHYVNNPVWPLDKTVAMINLDMVGRLVQEESANSLGDPTDPRRNGWGKLTVGGIGTATGWEELVKNLNRYQFNEKQTNFPGGGIGIAMSETFPFELSLNQDGFGPSDHSSFYGKQIPVLFFFTGTHSDYHKPTDTFEKVNYKGLTRIANYVSAIAKSVDSNPIRPTYKVAQAAPTGGRMTFNVSLGTIPSYGDSNDGLTIDGAREGSPAAKAGMKGGDKIIKLAGKDVRNISDYMFAMSTMKAGDEYEIVIKRGTETLTLKIVPAPAVRN